MKDSSGDQFQRLIGFLKRLHDANIPHSLADNREDAVTVIAYAPGEYWEIDFLSDGDVDVERYRSQGVSDSTGTALEELFALWLDDKAEDSVEETDNATLAGK